MFIPNQLPSPKLIVSWPSISGGTTAVSAGTIYFNGFELLATTTFSAMRLGFGGSPTGNVQLGVYDSTAANSKPGVLQGSTALVAATAGMNTINLTQNMTLNPGQYWMAMMDTQADTTEFIVPGEGLGVGMGPFYQSTATFGSLPANIAGAVTVGTNAFGFQLLVLNGYS